MKVHDLKTKIIFLQVVVVVLAIFVMMLGISVILQKQTLAEWKHLIDFLTIWVRENGLTIKLPGTGV
jgi:hypothetical protein